MARQHGFTLVELVMVIVILAIIAAISVRFIQFSTQGAIDTAERQQMAMAASVMTERMSRDLREALPKSVEAFSNPENDGDNENNDENNCIRFIPIEQGGRYVAGDRTEPAQAFATEGQPLDGETKGKVAIYPYSEEGSLYPLKNASVVSHVSGKWEKIEGPDDRYEIRFGKQIAFEANSPRRRFFLIEKPVSYCADLREDPGLLRRSDPDSTEIAGVGLSEADFTVERASLERNALVTLELTLQADRTEETYSLSQEVQIRNVP